MTQDSNVRNIEAFKVVLRDDLFQMLALNGV